jgi:large subunit ribosomal protein L18
MLQEQNQTRLQRKRRTMRVRKKLQGTEQRPRLCVVKSNRHLQAQMIDDANGVTLGAISTLSKELRNTEFNRINKNSAKQLGQKLAEIALKMNIREVIFDRGRAKYHGVLAEFADAARGAGLKF